MIDLIAKKTKRACIYRLILSDCFELLHLTNTENVARSSPASFWILSVYLASSSDLAFLMVKPTMPVLGSISQVNLGPSVQSRVPFSQVTVGNGLPSTTASMKSVSPSIISLFSGFSINVGASCSLCGSSLGFTFRSLGCTLAVSVVLYVFVCFFEIKINFDEIKLRAVVI